MNKIGLLMLAMVIVAGATGCGGDDSTGPSPTDITGAWQATKAEFVSRATGAAVELVASGGSATLVLGADHSFLLTASPVGRPAEVTMGTWKLEGDVMTVTPAGMPFSLQFDVAFSGDRLSLTGAHVEYDVNDDGRDEEAVLNLELVR
jgi:hypothetical protein